MKSFEILPHTADVRLRIRADSLEELFESALEGMNSIMRCDFSKSLSLMNFRDTINVNSPDTSSLLIDFLSEILTLSHAHKALYYTIAFKELKEKTLSADVEGNAIDGFDEDIKAVTYTEAEIRTNSGGQLETTIVFDI